MSKVNPSFWGESIIFNVGVDASTPATITPQGIVQFIINGTVVDTANLDSKGEASFSKSDLEVGNYTIRTTYVGNENFYSSSNSLNQQVDKIFTTTVLASTANPSAYGQNNEITATIISTHKGKMPFGEVQFLVDEQHYGQPVILNDRGQASMNVSNLSTGKHRIEAFYLENEHFNSSNNSLNQQVNKASTRLTLTASKNPSNFGSKIAYTAVVTSDYSIPTGAIQFQIDKAMISKINLDEKGVATFAISDLQAGNHMITAVYMGDSNFINSNDHLSQKVSKADTTTTIVSDENDLFFGSSPVVTVTVSSDEIKPIGSIEFSVNGIVSITKKLDSLGRASFLIPNLNAGDHAISAHYLGNINFNESVGDLTQKIKKANTETVLNSSQNPSIYSSETIFVATVASQNARPNGYLDFKMNEKVMATTSLDHLGRSSFAISTLDAGNHKITAHYLGSSNFNESLKYLTQQVNKADAKAVLGSSKNPSIFGSEITFTVTVASQNIIPGGTVEFKINENVMATKQLDSQGQSSFSLTDLDAGSHKIEATYLGNNNFKESISSLTQQVKKASTQADLSTSEKIVEYGSKNIFSVEVSSHNGEPNGSIEFSIDGKEAETKKLDAKGRSAFIVSDLEAGPHNMTVHYLGNNNFHESSDNVLLQVKKADTEITLDSSQNPSDSDQEVLFTAAVTSQKGKPEGTIELNIDDRVVAKTNLDPQGGAVFSISDFDSGKHKITAKYLGDKNFKESSVSLIQEVNKADSSIVLISSENPSNYNTEVLFTVTVASKKAKPEGPVEFKIDEKIAAKANLDSGEATFSVSDFEPGSHKISVDYLGDTHFNGSSANMIQQVIKTE